MVRATSELVVGRALFVGALCALLAAGCIRGGAPFDFEDVDETRYGNIAVTTTTTGASTDSDGYVAELDEVTSSPVPANGETAFASVAQGYYNVRLADIDPPCAAVSDQVAVYVFADSTALAHFDVDCP